MQGRDDRDSIDQRRHGDNRVEPLQAESRINGLHARRMGEKKHNTLCIPGFTNVVKVWTCNYMEMTNFGFVSTGKLSHYFRVELYNHKQVLKFGALMRLPQRKV